MTYEEENAKFHKFVRDYKDAARWYNNEKKAEIVTAFQAYMFDTSDCDMSYDDAVWVLETHNPNDRSKVARGNEYIDKLLNI